TGMPMIKTILVAATGGDNDTASFAAALAVARMFGAHFEVLHVRLDAVNTAVAMTTDAGTGALTGGLIERLEADARQREAKARGSFNQFCTGAGLAQASAPAAGAAAPSAEFHAESGDEPRWMASYGTAADLIIGRRGGGYAAAAARSTLEAALLDTG